jgi:hypothetical protein
MMRPGYVSRVVGMPALYVKENGRNEGVFSESQETGL